MTMKRPIATLNLPRFKINELHNIGYIFIDDINLESSQSDINITPEEWNELIKSTEFKSVSDLCTTDRLPNRINTFSNKLNSILGGGIALETITEIMGHPGSGKTQMCLQLCLSTQLPSCFGSLSGNCVFIDSKLNFNPNRLSDIAQGCIEYCHHIATANNSIEMLENCKYLTVEKLLKGVYYMQTIQFTQLLATIDLLEDMLIKNNNIKLIVIDNITQPFKNTGTKYYKVLYTFIFDLQKLAHVYKFAIILTNDMTTKFHENGSMYETSCLGNSFSHLSNTRIKLEHVSSNLYHAKILKSVHVGLSTAKFQILESGIRFTE